MKKKTLAIFFIVVVLALAMSLFAACDDAGNIVRETTNKMLDVESDRVKYVQTYEKDGHSMWYVFAPYSYLYYRIELM